MIVQRRDEVIDRWMERFQERLGPGIPPPTDVVDSVSRFLDEIVRQLTEPLQELEASARRVSGPHGRHRFFGGTDLRTVVLEFETILEVLVDMVIDYAPRVELAAWMRLHRWLFTGLKEAVATYTAARNQQLEEQTSEYLSFLAHELRNPVTSLSLALQVMRKRIGAEEKRSADIMARNLDRIMDLIDQQLVGLRLQAGVPVHPERLDAREALWHASTNLQPNATSKNQHIVIDAEPGLVFPGDARLVRSVLSNLIGNAIKFSHEAATIILRAHRTDSAIEIGVEDECGGLSEHAIDRMFEPFVQLGVDRSGHGLGLPIARQAMEAHGGSLRVRNIPGKGCEMIATFPMEQPTAEAQPPVQPAL